MNTTEHRNEPQSTRNESQDTLESASLSKGPNNPVRLIGILLWTLLPCLAIWMGMCQLKSAAWSFFLYHAICLLPAILWGKSLWLPTFRRPTKKMCAALLVSSVVFSGIALFTYEFLGNRMLSNDSVLTLLKDVGFSKSIFWPLSIYAIVVNPLVEELFWRGVVLNELDKLKTPFKHFGLVWSSLAYAAFHYTIFRLVLFPGWAEVGTLMLAVYGAFLAVLYRRSGSIVTISMAHGLLTDMAAIVLLLDLFRRYPGVL